MSTLIKAFILIFKYSRKNKERRKYDDLLRGITFDCISKINKVTVVDNNKVVGILTLGDLAKYSQKTGQENFSNTFEEICDCGHKNNR